LGLEQQTFTITASNQSNITMSCDDRCSICLCDECIHNHYESLTVILMTHKISILQTNESHFHTAFQKSIAPNCFVLTTSLPIYLAILTRNPYFKKTIITVCSCQNDLENLIEYSSFISSKMTVTGYLFHAEVPKN
jgi:hypothetical protein